MYDELTNMKLDDKMSQGSISDTDDWLPSIKTHKFTFVMQGWRRDVPAFGTNTTPADALAPKVPRASVGMVSDVLDIYHCLRVTFIYWDQAESKIWFKCEYIIYELTSNQHNKH